MNLSDRPASLSSAEDAIRPPTGNEPKSKPGPATFPWGSFVKATAALSAVAAVVLHFVGYVSHKIYLQRFGLDPNLFPMANDALLIHGYYAIFDRSTYAVEAIRRYSFYFLCAVLGMGTYTFVVTTVGAKIESARPQRLAAAAQRLRPTLRRLVRHLGIALMVAVVLPIMLFCFASTMAIPGLLGETAGSSWAEKDLVDFKKGCGKAKATCFQLGKDGKLVASGFYLDSTNDFLAFFDSATGQAKIVSRQGTDWTAQK